MLTEVKMMKYGRYFAVKLTNYRLGSRSHMSKMIVRNE